MNRLGLAQGGEKDASLSLRGLAGIQVVVSPLPAVLEAAGLTDVELEVATEKMFKMYGITVVERDEVITSYK